MAELALNSGIPRFKSNEARVDRFANGADSESWQTSGGVSVPSLRKFLKDTRTQISAETLDFFDEASDGLLTQIANNAGIAVSSKDISVSSANTAIAAKDAAVAAAAASGDVAFFDTKADALAATLAEGDIVEIFADESRGYGRTRYAMVSGTLVYKVSLDTTQRMSSRIPREFFGMHIAKAIVGDSPQTPYHDLGYGSLRLWDCGVRWGDLEPTKGNWQLARLDAYKAYCVAHNLRGMLTLGQAPAFATGGVTGGGNGGTYNSLLPTDPQDWIDYVTTISTRYAGFFDYQIWNEVNLTSFMGGTAEDLFELHTLAYDIIKGVDPQAKVIGPSMTIDNGTDTDAFEFLDTYMGLGAGDYQDASAVHLYVFPNQPEHILDVVRKWRGIMAKHGFGDMPIWNTEFGCHAFYNDDTGVLGVAPTVMPDLMAAGYVVRMLALCWMAGLDRTFWYGMDHSFNTIRLVDLTTPSTVLPAGEAFQATTDLMMGASMVDYARTRSGTWLAYFISADDSRKVVAWNGDMVTTNLDTTALNLSIVADSGSDGAFDDPIVAERMIKLRRPIIASQSVRHSMFSAAASSSTVDGFSATITANSDFLRRSIATGLPFGWSLSGSGTAIALCTETDRPTDTTITFSLDSQFDQMVQVLNRPLEPGLYKIWIDYKTVADGYVVALQTPGGNGGLIFNPNEPLPASAGFSRHEVVVAVTRYDSSIRLQLIFTGTSGFQPIHVAGFGIDILNRLPAQPEPYTRQVRYDNILDPTTGNWVVGDMHFFTSNGSIGNQGAIGEICTTAGTSGTLTGVTATATSAARTITVNTPDAIKVGQFVKLGANATVHRIVQRVSSTVFNADANIGADHTAAAVAFAAPAFTKTGITRKTDLSFDLSGGRLDAQGAYDSPVRFLNGNRYLWTNAFDLMFKNATAPAAAGDGQVLSRNLDGSETFDFPSVAAGAISATRSITLVGAALGDFVKSSFSGDAQGVEIVAWVSAADTVSYFLRNSTAAAHDFPSTTYRFRVEKRLGAA